MIKNKPTTRQIRLLVNAGFKIPETMLEANEILRKLDKGTKENTIIPDNIVIQKIETIEPIKKHINSRYKQTDKEHMTSIKNKRLRNSKVRIGRLLKDFEE